MAEEDIWHHRRSDDDQNRPNDQRSPFERDRARILHSAAFRRLQAKTQILGIGENDFYRTRLTHSLEVSQIGSSLLAQLEIKSAKHSAQLAVDHRLMEAICLAHDIGHPPFGHGGEIALNYMMRGHGGFEGNGQTLRILSKLEPYTQGYGMNLTRRTLLGLLKYPNTLDRLTNPSTQAKSEALTDDRRKIKSDDWKPAKGIYAEDQHILDWLLKPLCESDKQLFQSYGPGKNATHHNKTQYKSLDASIMELADDIAYGVHDLEDAVVVGNISKELWFDIAVAQFKALGEAKTDRLIDTISNNLFGAHHQCKEAIGQLVNVLITSVEYHQVDDQFDQQLLRYNARLPEPQQQILNILKKFIYQYLICKPELQQVQFKGQKIVMDLFEAFASDPQRLLPHNSQNRWLKAQDSGNDPQRVICDYIAGMTDEYATTMFQKLFSV